ncbi:unnamed protein product [Pelagomonas calceolata]|uniref:RING-CH-type domain-containing protein n=1 Tax=Pelagomonas calceolata TaxID=35677 RepID=A0A8J2WXD3_9STRA|nr:unnamed protein product [Pelagomonas calceolata]
MDQRQPAGEGERIRRSRSRSAQGLGSAARSFSRSRSRSPVAAREPRDVARRYQLASLLAPTTAELVAEPRPLLTATAEPPPWFLYLPDQADQKYEEASAVAVNACAEDTKGQTCWICFDDGSEEGLVRGCACRGGAGFAHLSCLAKQAKILVAEALENNLFDQANERFNRWDTCGLCEQKYHGVVQHALGWACWKTYVGLPEADRVRVLAMNLLGNGLSAAKQHEDALSVREAEMSMLRRLGDSEGNILIMQGNLASSYRALGRLDEAISMRRDVYSGWLKLEGEESRKTLLAANNYASTLRQLERFKETKVLLRKMMPVARRVLGESHDLMLRMRWIYGKALYKDDAATLDDLREAVTTFEEIERIGRRVFGGAHPLVAGVEGALRQSRATLRGANANERHFPLGTQVS